MIVFVLDVAPNKHWPQKQQSTTYASLFICSKKSTHRRSNTLKSI